MSHRNVCFVTLLVFGLVLFSAGCKKKPADMTPDSADTGTIATPADPEPERVEVEDPGSFKQEEPVVAEIPRPTHDQIRRQLQTVFFAFDQYDLSAEGRRTLQANYNVLRDNESFDVIIEGHCDERGTIEYNLALGEKRAAAVRDYLVSLGLSRSRLRIVSYGEERPEDSSHAESAWAKNRRAAFEIDR